MLIIEEDILLNALLAALLTVKFEARPEDVGEVAASPLVAEVCNRTYEALITAQRAKGHFGTAQRIEDSRSAEHRTVAVQAVHAHIRHFKTYWQKCEQVERRQFVRVLLSPYTVSEEFVEAIVQEANQP